MRVTIRNTDPAWPGRNLEVEVDGVKKELVNQEEVTLVVPDDGAVTIRGKAVPKASADSSKFAELPKGNPPGSVNESRDPDAKASGTGVPDGQTGTPPVF